MKKRILIVEDNELNLKLFRDLLTAHGYETIETKEGLEAITLTRSERPDLISIGPVLNTVRRFLGEEELA
jgi:two-component system cell cycle response regulator DivK